MTKELAQELKALGVTDEVVIPIDGLAPTYAKLKACKEEDFYKTIQNIKDAENILKIVIHINVSEASKADVEPLISLLRNEYKIKSFIKAINIAPQNTSVINENNSMNLDDLQKAIKIAGQSHNKNYVTNIKRGYGCEARHPDYYVIGTKGELYICEHLIGQDQYIMGNIKNQSGSLDRTGTIWDKNRIIDECRDCPIVPICLGFCTSQRYIDHIDCEKDKRIQITKDRLLNLIASRSQQP